MSPTEPRPPMSKAEYVYSVLLDEIRSELAKRCLADTDFRLEQVAYLTGYSEPAALVRAFKRWTGQTPIQYRGQQAQQA